MSKAKSIVQCSNTKLLHRISFNCSDFWKPSDV